MHPVQATNAEQRQTAATLGPSPRTWATGPPVGSYETTSAIAIIMTQPGSRRIPWTWRRNPSWKLLRLLLRSRWCWCLPISTEDDNGRNADDRRRIAGSDPSLRHKTKIRYAERVQCHETNLYLLFTHSLLYTVYLLAGRHWSWSLKKWPSAIFNVFAMQWCCPSLTADLGPWLS